MLRRQILALALLLFFAFPATLPLKILKTEKDAHPTSWLPPSTHVYTPPSLDVDKWQTITKSHVDVEGRRDKSLLFNQNDLNFFDQLFNSVAKKIARQLTNRTTARYKFPDGTDINYTLCHLATFLDYQTNIISTDISINALRELASTLMAIWDVNTGDNSVIPQIEQCNGRFNLRFTTEFFDGAHDPITSAKELTRIMKRRNQHVGAGENNVVKAYPSANIGPLRSSIANLLSNLAGVNDLITISHAASAIELASSQKYPLFGRTIPSTVGDAMAVVSFFSEFLEATHVGVLYINDKYGVSYALSLRVAAGRIAASRIDSRIIFETVPITARVSREDARRAILQLKQTGIRYIVAILFEEELRTVMPLSYEMGIAGENYFWMFAETILSLATSPESDIAQVLHGSAILGPATGKDLLQGTRFYDVYTSRFSALWESKEGWSYLQSKVPYLNLKKDILIGSEPSVYELFLYEAVVAVCLASCDAAENTTSDFFTANELFESFTKTTFDGVYGPASFENKTGDRSIDTVEYAVYNILTTGNTTDIKAIYRRASKIQNDTTKTLSWEPVGDREFIYAAGSTTPPNNLPPLRENRNIISTGTAAFCLVLCGLVLLFSALAAVWTYKRRSTKVVRASQPIFLYMLCVGTFIMGSSIIPQSLLAFDLSQSGLDAACMSVFWLFFPGFTISFSALFSKTMRINKIMSMGRQCKRVVIKPIDVLKPFFSLMAVNLAILITWTIVEPLEYDRYIKGVSVDRYGRYIESYGSCWPPYEEMQLTEFIFAVLLMAANLSAVVFSCYHAYRSRNISTEYNESQYIGMTVFAVLEILVIGGIIFVISNEYPTVVFVIFSLVVSGLSFAILFPMFFSKGTAVQNERHMQKKKEEEKKKRLERLRVFDRLKMQQEEAKPSAMAIAVPNSTPTADEGAPQDDDCGVEIVSSLGKADSCRIVRDQIYQTQVENKELRKSICTLKSSIDNLRSSINEKR